MTNDNHMGPATEGSPNTLYESGQCNTFLPLYFGFLQMFLIDVSLKWRTKTITYCHVTFFVYN